MLAALIGALISRFSKRSIVATMTFMATGFVTVFFVEHVLK